jgi:hypothetical protein
MLLLWTSYISLSLEKAKTYLKEWSLGTGSLLRGLRKRKRSKLKPKSLILRRRVLLQLNQLKRKKQSLLISLLLAKRMLNNSNKNKRQRRKGRKRRLKKLNYRELLSLRKTLMLRENSRD